jgi:hypothetical protein
LAAREDRTSIVRAFGAAVNLTGDELAEWLASPESRAVGWKGPDGQAAESVGHASGRRILAILRTPAGEWSDDDYAHMRKTIGFIHRHRAQRPANILTSRWRYSLMNWGHDPLKEEFQ